MDNLNQGLLVSVQVALIVPTSLKKLQQNCFSDLCLFFQQDVIEKSERKVEFRRFCQSS